ncbi:GNAT family N-acetyltransferase [Bacillus sp. T3]|uniref:GNAT family N-acetyltransferase n=1 Tax=Bacillus sp. T3 TaxID=467262 RepID=UPI0029823C7A|nr:GNAT family N-acetyltransferase [Bacillus sp. T3]
MRKKSNSQRSKQMNYFEQDSTFYFCAGETSGGVPYGITWEEMVSQELILRLAENKDSKKAAELIHNAITDIAEQLTGQTKTENIRETLAYFFREKNNRLSFQNTIIADVLDEVVGLIITYPGDDASGLDEPILSRLRKKRRNQEIYFDKEAEPGDYYIDTVSVNPKFQGYGIGTALIKEAEKVAKRMGFSRVSLNVANDNPTAKALYKKLGYHVEKVIQINGHNYDYMVRILKG